MYAKIDNNVVTQYPLSEYDIKKHFSHISFPSILDSSLPQGYVRVELTVQPAITSFQSIVEGTPTFNGINWIQTWVISELPEADKLNVFNGLKEAKHGNIINERNRREQLGFTYMGKAIDSDSTSVQRITVAVQAAQSAISTNTPFSLDWTCQDNSILTMSATDLVGMSIALTQHGNLIHVRSRELKSLLNAITYPNILALETFNPEIIW